MGAEVLDVGTEGGWAWGFRGGRGGFRGRGHEGHSNRGASLVASALTCMVSVHGSEMCFLSDS